MELTSTQIIESYGKIWKHLSLEATQEAINNKGFIPVGVSSSGRPYIISDLFGNCVLLTTQDGVHYLGTPITSQYQTTDWVQAEVKGKSIRPASLSDIDREPLDIEHFDEWLMNNEEVSQEDRETAVELVSKYLGL